MTKYLCVLWLIGFSAFLAGCDGSGGSNSTVFFDNNGAIGGTTVPTPGANPNLPNPASATITLVNSDQSILPGTAHVFMLQVSGVSGFGNFSALTLTTATSGTVTGLPVDINFGPLTQVGVNTFQAIGVFTGPLVGPGTISALISYTEGGSGTSTVIVFTVLPFPSSGGGGGGGAGGGGGTGGPTPLLVCDADVSSVFIPDLATVTSTISVSGPTLVNDLNVFVNIRHEFPGDLTITLTSPGGTSIDLSSGNGGSSDHVFSPVTFDDAAASSITTISVAGGTFSPEEPLSTFNGSDPSGMWTLTLGDTFSVDPGVLVSWCLAFNSAGITPPSAGTPIAFSSAVGADFGGSSPFPASPASVSDSITVSGGPTVLFDVRVRVDILHDVSSFVSVTLDGPVGTMVLTPGDSGTPPGGFVFDYGGFGADTFSTVIFDDFATIPISSATVPGTYLPEDSFFGSFAGVDANGTWTITVTDIFPTGEFFPSYSISGISGTFVSWDIAFDESTFLDGL